MKKRLLMPLLVAGLMLASVVCLDSCKKNNEVPKQNWKAVLENAENDPLIDEEVSGKNAEYVCPYCHVELHHGDVHYHYFGEVPEGFDVSYLPAGEPFGVNECIYGLSANSCPYSGALEGDEGTIQAIMAELGVSHQVAEWMLLPRFHAHRVTYRVVVDGGMTNKWHVGGGVPGWPGWQDPENPNEPNP